MRHMRVTHKPATISLRICALYPPICSTSPLSTQAKKWRRSRPVCMTRLFQPLTDTGCLGGACLEKGV
jgi:hypothetical protein